MKKFIFLVVIITALTLTAKHVIATRAHNFIMECLSAEEVELILEESVTPLKKEKQLEITKRALPCVRSKQNILEGVIFNALGGKLFYQIGGS